MAVLTDLMSSAATFKKGTVEKLSFVTLNIIDLYLTFFAVSRGATELNPMMQSFFHMPLQLYFIKLALPILMAWLIPGKLLLPATTFLIFVVGWDIKELVILLR